MDADLASEENPAYLQIENWCIYKPPAYVSVFLDRPKAFPFCLSAHQLSQYVYCDQTIFFLASRGLIEYILDCFRSFLFQHMLVHWCQRFLACQHTLDILH